MTEKVGFAHTIDSITNSLEANTNNVPTAEQIQHAVAILNQSGPAELRIESLIQKVKTVEINAPIGGNTDTTELLMALRRNKNLQKFLPTEWAANDDIFRTILRVSSTLDAARLETKIIVRERGNIGSADQRMYARLTQLKNIGKDLAEQVSIPSRQQKI